MAQPIKAVAYSEKSFAVIGDTKSIKEKLKQLKGRYNPRLRYGPGWIFSNRAQASVEEALGIKVQSPDATTVETQHIQYTVPLPRKGMTASIKLDDPVRDGVYDTSIASVYETSSTPIAPIGAYESTIHEVTGSGPAKDLAVIEPFDHGDETYDQLAVVRGSWQVLGLRDAHTVTFRT